MQDDFNTGTKTQIKAGKLLQFDSDKEEKEDFEPLNADTVDKTDALEWNDGDQYNIKSPGEKSSHQSSQSEKEKIKSIMEIRGQLKLKKEQSASQKSKDNNTNSERSKTILSPSLEPSQMTKEQVLALLQSQVNSPGLKPIAVAPPKQQSPIQSSAEPPASASGLLLPTSMLSRAREHVRQHGIDSVEGLIDENEQIICKMLENSKIISAETSTTKLTPEMKQELVNFLKSSVGSENKQ